MRLVFKAIQKSGPLSKRDLQRLTGLSWSAVSSIVGLLIESGYVISFGKQTTTVGRKPDTLDIQTHNWFAIGVELNCIGLNVVVTDLKGTPVIILTRIFTKNDAQYVWDTLFSLLDNLFRVRLAGKTIIGIGFAVQGVVDSLQGRSLLVTRIHGWRDIPLRDIIQERYACPTVVMHDTDCLMKAECTVGSPTMSNADNALLVHMDYTVGLGMSVMINRHIYLGYTGKSGEIGRMLVNVAAPGDPVFLEDYLSEESLARDFQKKVPEATEVTCDKLAQAARGGNVEAREVFISMGEHLGRALVNCANVFNPELIMLNGTLAQYNDLFLPRTREILEKYVYEKDTRLEVSKLDRNGAAHGAALVMIDEHSNSLILDAQL